MTGSKTPYSIEFYKDKAEKWRWRMLRGKDIMAASSESFDSKEAAEQNIENLKQGVSPKWSSSKEAMVSKWELKRVKEEFESEIKLWRFLFIFSVVLWLALSLGLLFGDKL